MVTGGFEQIIENEFCNMCKITKTLLSKWQLSITIVVMWQLNIHTYCVQRGLVYMQLLIILL